MYMHITHWKQARVLLADWLMEGVGGNYCLLVLHSLTLNKGITLAYIHWFKPKPFKVNYLTLATVFLERAGRVLPQYLLQCSLAFFRTLLSQIQKKSTQHRMTFTLAAIHIWCIVATVKTTQMHRGDNYNPGSSNINYTLWLPLVKPTKVQYL